MIWVEIRDPNYYRNVSAPTANCPTWQVPLNEPAPTVMAPGMRGATPYLVSDDGPVPTVPPNLADAEPGKD
jgi:hypothetical protein